MPHLLERAPTGRAKCRGCSRAIAAGDWRFGERLPNPYADGEGAEMTHWYHPICAAFKRPEPLVEFLRARPLAAGTIGTEDVERLVVTDSPVEVARSVADTAMRRFGLTYGPRAKPRWYLGER